MNNIRRDSRRATEPEGSFARGRYAQFPTQIFVYFTPVIYLLLLAERANMCTTERENKKTKRRYTP